MFFNYFLLLMNCDVPHRHPTYVGALDFELWPCFVKIIFFANFLLLPLIENTTSKQYKFEDIEDIEDTLVLFFIKKMIQFEVFKLFVN